MNSYLEQIIQNANLEVVEYNMETRREMNTRDRRLPYYVMSYLKSGCAVLEIDGTVYETEEGSIVIIPANVLHSHYKIDRKPTTFLWWHFIFKMSYAVDVVKILDFPVVSQLKNRGEFENIFSRFYNGSKNMNKISEVLMQRACGLELMACLMNELISEKRLLPNMEVPPVFWSIFQKIYSEDNQHFTLNDLAEEYHMSATYISNRFKHFFGKAPIAMRNDIILERAKDMLQSTELSVSEIAERFGFAEVCAFTHFFTKRMKMSPSGYRKQYRQLI